MIKHTVFYALAFLFLQSCKKEAVNLHENKTVNSAIFAPEIATDTVTVKSTLRLETFPMPAEVEGCSCYFAENKANYENEKYVYVDDYGKSAYIKIDGKMIKIPMQEDDLDPSNFTKNIENSDYKINLSGKKINEMDETMMFQGTMTVKDKKTGDRFSTPIYGECGC
ncbi:MAG: hypothetical protein ACXWVZ_06570 [Kaistella sp.]